MITLIISQIVKKNISIINCFETPAHYSFCCSFKVFPTKNYNLKLRYINKLTGYNKGPFISTFSGLQNYF